MAYEFLFILPDSMAVNSGKTSADSTDITGTHGFSGSFAAAGRGECPAGMTANLASRSGVVHTARMKFQSRNHPALKTPRAGAWSCGASILPCRGVTRHP